MLPAIAREAARQFADATAYVAPDGWALSYRELDRVSDELAVGLARRGLAAGDVLALVLPPSPNIWSRTSPPPSSVRSPPA